MEGIGESRKACLTREGGPAAIGADDDPRRDRVAGTIAFKLDFGRQSRADLDPVDASHQDCPCFNRGGIEHVANPGMPEIKGAANALHHLIHAKGEFPGNLGRHILPIGNGSDGVIATGALQQVENAQCTCFRHSPGYDELASYPIDVNRGFLQHQDAVTGAGERNRERTARDSRSNDNDIQRAIRAIHELPGGNSSAPRTAPGRAGRMAHR